MSKENEVIEAQVLDAREKFGTSRLSDAADRAQVLAKAMPGIDPEFAREFFISGARAMLENLISAHNLAMHYPEHQKVFIALMSSLQAEINEHVEELLAEIVRELKKRK